MLVKQTSINRWVTIPRPIANARLRLFCFPYAGGTSQIYRSWYTELPAEVETCTIQLPGHGNRLTEPLINRLTPLLDDLTPSLRPFLDKPFAFFGHSMGALIAFELTRRLRREIGREPHHLFVSAHRAPQTRDTSKRTFELPENEFIEELGRLNGTPREVLDHPELLELMIPVLRADFAIAQTHEHVEEPPLGCSLTAFGGVRDMGVTREHLEAWRIDTTGPFNVRMFPGDHFYLHGDRSALLREISRELMQTT